MRCYNSNPLVPVCGSTLWTRLLSTIVLGLMGFAVTSTAVADELDFHNYSWSNCKVQGVLNDNTPVDSCWRYNNCPSNIEGTGGDECACVTEFGLCSVGRDPEDGGIKSIDPVVAGPWLTGWAGAFEPVPDGQVRNPNHGYDFEPPVWGTDLGLMYFNEFDETMYFLFGDTRRDAITINWWNPVAYSTDTDASDGIVFDGWLMGAGNQPGDIIPNYNFPTDPNACTNVTADPIVEFTKAPTAGFVLHGYPFVWLQSISFWGWWTSDTTCCSALESWNPWDPEWPPCYMNEDGSVKELLAYLVQTSWKSNTSRLYFSDNPFWTVSFPTQVEAAGSSNFAQVTTARYGDWLLLWGLSEGRLGGVKLARVKVDPIQNVSDPNAYQYFNGATEPGENPWSTEMADATDLGIPPPVGDSSVMWNPYLKRWIMMSVKTDLEPETGNIVVREAQWPQGPWSEPWLLEFPDDLPYYAPAMHEMYAKDGGRTVYFLVSQFGYYNVRLMQVTFQRNEG